MKKTLPALLTALALTLSLASCGSGSGSGSAQNDASSQDSYTVAIVQPMSHTSLDQIRDTIISTLEESDLDIQVVTRNANNDSTALSTLMEQCKQEGADLVIPIATSTAQSARTVFEGTDTPVVFAAVSDPEAAGLTGSGCENITGVSNNIPAQEIVDLIFNFQPDCKSIGFLYTSSEPNSVSTIHSAQAYCDQENIAYEEVSIANLSELQTAVETLVNRGVDALYTGNDNAIASAMATYTDVAYSAGIPIYCGADSMVADGGFATVGVNYVQLGEQVAQLALDILGGADPQDLPYQTLSDYARYVNLQAVERFGGSFDQSAYEGFEVLVEADGTSHFGG